MATYQVKWSTPGQEAKLQCGDGQTASFAGATTLSHQGPVTCLVRIGTSRGAAQVDQSTTVTCTEDAGRVNCSVK